MAFDRKRRVPPGFGALVVLCLAAAGCSRPAQDTKESHETAAAPVSQAPAPKPKEISIPVDPRYRQPFQDATLSEPPEGELRPPDTTWTGKSIGKVYEAISGKDNRGGLWDQISLVGADGKLIPYMATVKTDLGDITIELRPDIAPNHVRSFIALARAGYYDGLAFDRIIRQKVATEKEGPEEILECLEAGCPLGTGETGYGGIGYWLKPELSDKAGHDIGAVGACHGEKLESAGAKFYITLSKAPWMDGNWTIFGKVKTGLDVARNILLRPVREESRPEEPVRIRQVIIQP